MSGSSSGSRAVLEEENRQLKSQLQQLQKELSLKDGLITSLEAQIKNLIKHDGDGPSKSRTGSQNSKGSRQGLPPKAPNHRTPSRRSTDEDDDESSLPPQTHRRPSLDPPSRSEDDMSSPLQVPKQSIVSDVSSPRLLNRNDVLQSGVGTVLTESIEEEAYSNSEGRGEASKNSETDDGADSDGGVVEGSEEANGRRGLNKTKGAIKTLPRELSIFNSDDDDVTKYSMDDNMPTYHLESSTEMRDAYNARGLYTGSVSKSQQMPHGRGRMKYHHQGRSYEGDWVFGHWHGVGRIQNANGDVYEGQVQNDLREGKGKLFYADGRIFDGKFQEDDPVYGTLSFPDGARYVGELHNGARHGYGIYYFTDGSLYEGHSIMNIFEGKGKMTWTDGGWYEGEWHQGEIHGYGKEIRADGSLRHKGQWSKGVPIRL
jgi:hypothetical protein